MRRKLLYGTLLGLCLTNGARAQSLPEPAGTRGIPIPSALIGAPCPPSVNVPCPPSVNPACTPCPPVCKPARFDWRSRICGTTSDPCARIPVGANACNPCGQPCAVDANGNPITPSLVDANGNPISPCLVDANGNPIAPGCGDGMGKPPKAPLRERLGWVDNWDDCRPPPHFWFSGEYLYWHTNNGPVAATLAATSLSTNLVDIMADPFTLVNRVGWKPDYGMAPGTRWSMGTWLGECRALGLETNIMVFDRRTDGFTLSSAGNDQVILRPFINANTMAPDFAVVSFPGSATGSLTVESSSRVWGSEVNIAYRLLTKPEWELTPTMGVRYLDLAEDLTITQNTLVLANGIGGFLGTPVGPDSRLTVTDSFSTHSQFFGGQFGTRFGKRFNRLTINSFLKVGIGWVHESSTIEGSTVLHGPGGNVAGSTAGGLLAVPSNSGRWTADELGILPEFGVTVGYDVTTWLRFTAGYSALYWSRVVRPGSQVGAIVNPSEVPASLQFGQGGPAAPVSPLNRNDLWLNGVTIGAMLRF